MSKIKSDSEKVHATRTTAGISEKVYTKHTLVVPGVDPKRAVVAKSAWQYSRQPDNDNVDD